MNNISRFHSCLFLTDHELDSSKGISKKILSQVAAIREYGLQTFLLSFKEINKHQFALIDNEIFFELGNKYKKHLYSNGLFYGRLVRFIKDNQIECLYIRYTQFVDAFFLSFLRRVHKLNCTILMEIPTYPYDGEFPSNNIGNIVIKWKDILLRKFFKFYVDRIVTFSDDESIFGIPCINISNAVDADSIKLTERKPKPTEVLTMIGVANVNFWHGYDRMIEGLKNYYEAGGTYPVRFLIVGNGNSTVYNMLLSLIDRYHLQGKVELLGPKSGKELDELFNLSDIAIGSLGSHRKNIIETKTLKNVEYAMRGLPIVYAEKNNDFDLQKYVHKVPADETPINIMDIIAFSKSLNISPVEIRSSAAHLTWKEQMKKVFQSIN